MKKYHIGMYGGKFIPFHKGHAYCVEVAALECERVYVIMFYGGHDEEIILKEHPDDYLSVEIRKKQLIRMCNAASSLAEIIPTMVDISDLRLPDGKDDWEAETPLVREITGECLDAVYSSEECYDAYFKGAYPEAVHRLVDIKREHYPISGSMIRNMPMSEGEKWII